MKNHRPDFRDGDFWLLFNYLTLNVLKSESVDGICEAFAGLAFLAVEVDGALDYLEDLFLGFEELRKRATLRRSLAPSAAEADLVAVYVSRGDSEGTCALAASAMVAGVCVDRKLAVNELCRADRAGDLNLTFLAAAAFFKVVRGNTLTDYTEVVEVGLYAVVRTAADSDLEFVGKGNVVVTLIKTLVDLLAELVGLDQTEAAGRTLAGYNGTNERTRTSRLEAVRGEKFDQRIDVVVFDALNFDRKTGGHGSLTAAESVRSLRDRAVLV